MRGKSIRGNSAHFLALRKRLDLMGYVDLPLGLDTAPLAQQLLEDLVTTTEALRENEDELNKTKEKLEISETQIEPLQAENSRLTRENVQLHQQLILSSEESQRLENQHSAAAFELQNENRRLKLLNQKASEHVKELQKERDQIKEKLQQSIAAPSMMKVPEMIESDPRKMRTRTRSGSTSRGTSVVSSESSFTAPNISFDPNLFNTELDNLRKERDQARKDAETAITRMNELESVVKIRDDEINRLGSELQRETGRDGFLVSLRHKYDQQQEEIDKLRAQVRVVNPTSTTGRKPRRLILTPARTTVSIEDSVFIETSKTPSMISSAKDDTTDFTDTAVSSDVEDLPMPRAPIRPEPLPEQQQQPQQTPQDQQPQQQQQQQQSKPNQINVSDSEENNDDNNEEEDDDSDDGKKKGVSQVQFHEDTMTTINVRHHGSSKSSKSRVKIQQQQQQQQFLQQQQQQLINQSNINELTRQKDELQYKLERLERKNQKVLQSKEREINNLRSKIDLLVKQLSEKDQTISSMAADFAYINDNISAVMSEKDQMISDFRNKACEPSEIIYDTEEVDKLQFQLDEMKVEYERQIEAKDKQISQLQGLAQTLTTVPSVPGSSDCQECLRLKKRIEELEKLQTSTADAKREDIENDENDSEKLRARIAQLETLIRASQEEEKESAKLDEQLQIAKNQLTERDAQMEKIRTAAAKQQNEMKELQKKLVESEEKMKNLPDVEARYRTIIDQLKSEHVAINNEIRQKRGEIKSLNDKMVEAQRIIREKQNQLQTAREEAANAREEAAFHRAKSEEITKKAQEKSCNVVKDANAAVQHLQRQLQDKTKEAEVYQKLLSDARRQIAPMKETVIPQLKSQILKLKQEKDEILRKVKRISQLAIYVDANMTQSPDATAFSAAVHQLQDELRPYAQI